MTNVTEIDLQMTPAALIEKSEKTFSVTEAYFQKLGSISKTEHTKNIQLGQAYKYGPLSLHW